MIYFALTVLALRTAGHIIRAFGVNFDKPKENITLVNFLVHSIFITAYVYILMQFISLK